MGERETQPPLHSENAQLGLCEAFHLLSFQLLWSNFSTSSNNVSDLHYLQFRVPIASLFIYCLSLLPSIVCILAPFASFFPLCHTTLVKIVICI